MQKKIRNSSLIQNIAPNEKEKKKDKKMHAINWGIQVKKGLIDEKKKDI